MLNGEQEITDLTYLNGEHLGDGYGDRRAVFDVYCQLADGKKFIVEMQKAEQAYFKDRSIYYSTFPIREQAPKGGTWDYHLENVYTIGILNFAFPNDEYPADSFMHEIKLTDVEDKHVFYDKLTFIYLEMPKFNKTEDELVTMFDKWMFALRNLSRFLERPKALQERIFTRLFDQAEIARFSPNERREYQESIKDYWDYYSTMTTSYNKGKAEGRAEGLAEGKEEARREDAIKMKELGVSSAIIAQVTGLTVEEVEEL